MASIFTRSFGSLFSLLGKCKLSAEYRKRVEAYDQEFLNRITHPDFEDGRINRLYLDGLEEINAWRRQSGKRN